MAANDSNFAEVQESLADITECCICTETYKEPKILPCVHTFCLRCLQETGQRLNATPGDKMPCPVCRKEFIVPDDGFSGLQKNFFMERLIDVTKILNPSTADVLLCDACKEDDATTDVPLAVHFCVECHQNLCKECYKYHIKSKMTKKHQVLPLDKEQQSSVHLLPRMVPSLCDQHEGEMLKIYCKCCKLIVCAMCFVEHHTGHQASDVGKLANEVKETLNKDIESLLAVKSESINKMSKLEEIKTGFIENRNMLQEEINRRRSELEELIDRHSDSLLQNVNFMTEEKLKKIEIEREEIEFELVSLDSFVKYCTELTVKGSASDICQAGESLKRRADELQKLHEFNSLNELEAVRIHLQKSELEAFSRDLCQNIMEKIEVEEDWKKESLEQIEVIEEIEEQELDGNLKGLLQTIHLELVRQIQSLTEDRNSLKERIEELEDEHRKEKKEWTDKEQELAENIENLEEDLKDLRQKTGIGISKPVAKGDIYNFEPKLKHVIHAKSKGITGLALLGEAMYVVSAECAEIKIYESATFAFKRIWWLKHLKKPQHMASCHLKKRLYISNFYSKERPTGKGKYVMEYVQEVLKIDPKSKSCKSWALSREETGIFSISQNSNLIFCTKSKISEYNPNGELIRCTAVDEEFEYLRYVIRLTSGHFVLSHAGIRVHRVCILDADGHELETYGGAPGETSERMNNPTDLAIVEVGHILVVDYNNKRILLLSSNLEFKRVLLLPELLEASFPSKLLLDEENGRLFVVSSDVIRVFDITD